MQKTIHSLLLLGVLLAAGCSYQKRHMAKADKYFATGKYDDAEIEYINVVRRAVNFHAYKQLGIIYYQEGRMVLAAQLLNRAAAMNTNDAEVRVDLAKAYLSFGLFKRALDETRPVLEKDPANTEAAVIMSDIVTSVRDIRAIRSFLENLPAPPAKRAGIEVALGNLSLREKDFRQAQKHYENARALEPKLAVIYVGVADWYWAQNDIKLADEAFKKAIALVPARSPLRIKYAQFKVRTGDLAGSRAILEAMIKETPDYLPAYSGLAQIALGEKKYTEAAGEIDQILTKDPRDYEALMQRGKIANLVGDYNLAQTTFAKFDELYPKNPQTYYQLAVAACGNNDLDLAMLNLRKTLALQPNASEAVLLLDDIRIRQGHSEDAIPSLLDIIKAQPTNTPPEFMLASAYEQRGDFRAAVSVYDQIEKQLPHNAQLYWLKATALIRGNHAQQARVALEKSLELDPGFVAPLEQLVNMDLEAKDYGAVIGRLQKQLAQNPKEQAPRLLLARTYLVQNKTNDAEAALEKALELQPGYALAGVALAQIYQLDDKPAKALDTLKKVLTVDSTNVLALMRMGMVQSAMKDYTGARDSYEKVLALNPKFSSALNNLADLYSEKLNDLDKAYELATRLRNMVPPDPATAPYAADTLGWVLYKRGDYARATPLLEEAAASLGNEPEIQYHLALANYMNGQEDAARIILQRIAGTAEVFPGSDQIATYLSILAINPQTAGPEAKSMLEKRTAAQPKDLGAWTRLAAIYQREGSVSKAISGYENVLRLNARNVNALTHLADLYSLNRGDLPKALNFANQAYSLSPDSLEVSQVLGKVTYLSGNYKRALGALEQASIQHPGNAELLYNLALARYSVGQVDGAQSSLQTALQNDPAFPHATEAKSLLDMIALAATPAAAVPPQINQTLAKDPDNVPALMVVAGSQQKTDGKAARATYEKIVKIFPAFTPAERQLALIYAEDPSSDAAAYQIGVDARNAYPNDPQIGRALGIFSYRRGDYSRAKSLLRESAAGQPDNAKTLYYLGMTQLKLNELSDSKKNLRRALDLKLPDYAAKSAKDTLAGMK